MDHSLVGGISEKRKVSNMLKIECHTNLSLDVHVNRLKDIDGWEIVIYYASGGRYDNEVTYYSIGGNQISLALSDVESNEYERIVITSDEENTFSEKNLYFWRNKETEKIYVLPWNLFKHEESIFVRHNW